jgi:hypothetical protein
MATIQKFEDQSLTDMALAISRMLSGLMTYLRQSENRGRKFPDDDLQPVT